MCDQRSGALLWLKPLRFSGGVLEVPRMLPGLGFAAFWGTWTGHTPFGLFIILNDTRGETRAPVLGSIVPGPSLLTGRHRFGPRKSCSLTTTCCTRRYNSDRSQIMLPNDNMLHTLLPRCPREARSPRVHFGTLTEIPVRHLKRHYTNEQKPAVTCRCWRLSA